jgi:hypothetical protein
MSSCVRVAMSGAEDFGACGCFSRGPRGFRDMRGLPGWNSGASACKAAASSPFVSCPPNWRPPAAVRWGKRCAPPLPGPPLPLWPPLAGGGGAPLELSAVTDSDACAEAAEAPPRPLPRPLPLRPPLCVCGSAADWGSLWGSDGVFAFAVASRLRFRGRRRRCDPRSAPAGTVAGAWAVVAVDIAGGKTSAASGVSGVRMAGGMLDCGQKRK